MVLVEGKYPASTQCCSFCDLAGTHDNMTVPFRCAVLCLRDSMSTLVSLTQMVSCNCGAVVFLVFIEDRGMQSEWIIGSKIAQLLDNFWPIVYQYFWVVILTMVESLLACSINFWTCELLFGKEAEPLIALIFLVECFVYSVDMGGSAWGHQSVSPPLPLLHNTTIIEQPVNLGTLTQVCCAAPVVMFNLASCWFLTFFCWLVDGCLWLNSKAIRIALDW